MKHIRIGKDIRLMWTITTDGSAIPLEGRDLTLELKSPIGKVIILPYRLDGNILTMTYYGYEQTVVGEYSLTLWENKGKPGQNVVDAIRAFKLVRTSPEEEDFAGGDLQVESVDLGTANLEILSGGGASTPGESPDLSALEMKVNANTDSISKINAELDTVKEVQNGHSNSIAQINTTIEEHSERIARNKTSCDENASEIARVSNVVESHEGRLGNIDATISSQTESINGINNTLANHDAQIDNAAKSIESTNSALSALHVKVDANTTSISQIKSTLQEHTDSIAQVNTTVSSHANELSQIKTEQTEQNSTLADHEERLVYTEGDLVKVREEYNSIISELVKSIGHTQKAFVVETNDSEGVIHINNNEKKIIPANSIKGVVFNSKFYEGNSGIASFRFVVTDTSSITDMSRMFSQCSSIKSLDLSSFDTSKVNNMYCMFMGCSSLTSLDLSSFDTSSVVHNMSYMFRDCSSIKSLDLSSFETSKVKSMENMFDFCYSIRFLDLSSFDTSSVGGMLYMFRGLSSLANLLLGQNFFKTSAVTNIDFSSCSKWTNETVVTSLVTNSYDRAAAGLNTLTINLHANTKAALSDEQKATITNKGYTIA